MPRWILRRTCDAIVTVWLAVTAVFFLMRLSGDPALLLVPMDAPPAVVDAVRHRFGLDRPPAQQYLTFLERVVLHGDFGTSLRQPVPALERVLTAAPASLALAGLSVAVALALALPLGVVAALRRHSAWDRLLTALAVLLQSMPNFWLALMLVMVFAVRLHWLPTAGKQGLESYVLPVATLAFYSLARFARVTRSALLEQLRADYVRTARAKGLAERVVTYRHAFRNALNPVITMVGLQLSTLFGGAVVTESVFAWPGLGRLLVDSIGYRDYPVVLAAVTVMAVAVSLVNLLADLAYAVANPVVRVE